MSWHIICPITGLNETVDEFPFYVGRYPGPTGNCAVIDDLCVSRQQFKLEKKLTSVRYVNLSDTNPGELDGTFVEKEIKLAPFQSHILKLGEIVIGIGTDYAQTRKAALDNSPDLYMITNRDGGESGPLTGEQLVEGCEKGYFTPMTKIRTLQHPGNVMNMADVVDFEMSAPPNSASQTELPRAVTAEESKAELGESFMCPYCRTVSALEDVLSVSVSPGLLGDSVLGYGKQDRFLQ